MAKYENIRALAKKQLQAVTESSDRWKAFLRTAAIAYNYSFPNQLLIHEQSPTATAVADIAYWNNNAGRWVKRGAHGIAVFDTRANSSRLRYLFDISDTIPRAEIPEALPWVITDQNWRPVWDKIVADNHADSIQSALLMLSTSCVAQRSAMFTTALGKAIDGSSLQWAKPDEQRQLFIQLITQSCLYMAALRCGVDTARLDLSALESVNQFDSLRSVWPDFHLSADRPRCGGPFRKAVAGNANRHCHAALDRHADKSRNSHTGGKRRGHQVH